MPIAGLKGKCERGISSRIAIRKALVYPTRIIIILLILYFEFMVKIQYKCSNRDLTIGMNRLETIGYAIFL